MRSGKRAGGVAGIDHGSAWLSGSFVAGQARRSGFFVCRLAVVFGKRAGGVRMKPAREAAAGAGAKAVAGAVVGGGRSVSESRSAGSRSRTGWAGKAARGLSELLWSTLRVWGRCGGYPRRWGSGKRQGASCPGGCSEGETSPAYGLLEGQEKESKHHTTDIKEVQFGLHPTRYRTSIDTHSR